MRRPRGAGAGCWGALLLALALPAAGEPELPEGAAPAADAAAAAQRKVVEPVERLHAALLETMREADSLGYAGRYQHLDPVVRACFDLSFMAEKSVGRHWGTASPEQRVRLLDAFSRYTIANYAARFVGFSGQSFHTGAVEDSGRGTRLVHSLLENPEGDDVQLDYRMRPASQNGAWRIVDVYLDGTVSELALRRSEYASLIKREGLEALLSALDQRVADLETGSGKN